jgi:L-threonylcarbamoyladenylate synthase
MRIVNQEDISYKEIIDVLNNSGLIIFPTETCYGVGCNPLDQKAVDKLLAYKARREGKAISIGVINEEMAAKYVTINDTAKKIYDRFLPGPFTVISKSHGTVARGIEAENQTIGIRIPDYPWFLKLVEHYNNPITTTSANQSYQKTPYTISDILENATPKALELIDLIIDAGELPHNPPSTVMDTTLGEVQVVRKGHFLPKEARIREVVSNSEAETIALGSQMVEMFRANLEFRPILFALQGDLGAGKTQFTKGVAEAMGITKPILSPTFILSREYTSPEGNMLFHIDTWRLENAMDVKELGIEEMFTIKDRSSKAHNIVVIEWADKIVEYLRELNENIKIIWVEIVQDGTDDNRRVIKWCE